MRRETVFNLALLAAFLAVPLWAWQTDNPFLITLATRAVIFAIAGVGLNIALGFGGLVSFGHAAFFGLGGYAMGVLAFHAQSYTPLVSWPFELGGTKSMPVIWLTAILVAALAAWAIGLLSLRTDGVYFIMITLAFAQMLYYFAISWPAYGGEDGLPIYVRNAFPGLNTMVPIQFFAICFSWLLIILILVGRMARSPFGLMLGAARQNEERVEAVGQAPRRLYLTAFTLSGEIMVFVILDGVGRVFGPVAGAALYILLEHQLGGLSDYWQIYLGAILLGVVLFARGGLIGLVTGREANHD
jgi:branched-chain amino acid transport system permease protein